MTRPTTGHEIRQAAKARRAVPHKVRRRGRKAARVRVSQSTRTRSSPKNKGSVRYGDLQKKKSSTKASSRRSARIKVRSKKGPPVVSSSLPNTSKAARNLGLGNGSPSSEFLSAANRLLGIKDGFLHKSFLRHLLSVSAIDIALKAPHNIYAGLVFEHFKVKGREVKSPRPGDLVFFSTPHVENQAQEDRFTAAAVLEAIEPGGVYRCIGWVLGEVQRFKMDPRRPTLRRDERSGERINDVIRERSMSEGSSRPALAGQLLVGFLRL